MRKLFLLIVVTFCLTACDDSIIGTGDGSIDIEYQQVTFETKDIAFYRTFESEPEIKAVNWHAVLGEENQVVVYALDGGVYDYPKDTKLKIQFLEVTNDIDLEEGELIENILMDAVDFFQVENVYVYLFTNHGRFIAVEVTYLGDHTSKLTGQEYYNVSTTGLSQEEYFTEMDYDTKNYDYVLYTNLGARLLINSPTSIVVNQQNISLPQLDVDESVSYNEHKKYGRNTLITSLNRYIEYTTDNDGNVSEELQVQLPQEIQNVIQTFYDEETISFLTKDGNLFIYYKHEKLFYFVNNIIEPYDVEESNTKTVYPTSNLDLADYRTTISKDKELDYCEITDAKFICYNELEIYLLESRYMISSLMGDRYTYNTVYFNDLVSFDFGTIEEVSSMHTFDYQIVYGLEYYYSYHINLVTDKGVYVISVDTLDQEELSIIFEDE